MRRGEAWKPLRERGGWMRLSEKAVFYVLLDRADNGDCSIPAWMTPSIRQLAEACGCSTSTARLALRHLERHKWLTRASKTNAGRGHKASYQLADGLVCDCPPASKSSDSRPFHEEKSSDSHPRKSSDSHPENRRSAPVSDEGINEGKVKQGWPLARIPGVRGDIIPREPATRRALHLLADALGPVTVVSDEPN